MNLRTIKKVIPAFKVNMGDVVIDQALPNDDVEHIGPFLLVHHLNKSYPAGSKQETVGVPPHPHRGFAPVTFIYQGGVHHRDSMDIDSIIYEGGTQWMHAGKGIIHSERPPKEVAEEGKPWELIQFWVNLPAEHKMSDPQYQPLTAEETPTHTSEDGLVKVGVVAGDFKGTKGGIEPCSPMLVLRLDFTAEGEIDIPVPKKFNAFIYILDGKLSVNFQTPARGKNLILLENNGDMICLRGEETTHAILLAGEPINEPMATYGPFVMNHQWEISRALHDFQTGKMGKLVEKFD